MEYIGANEMKPEENRQVTPGLEADPLLQTYTRCPEHPKQSHADASAASVPNRRKENNSTLS